MSLGAKIGIVGLGVIALVAGGLYYIFVYARNGVNATVTGINRDAASATNAARDPGEPVAIDPDGTPRYGGLNDESPQRADYQDYQIQPVLNSTSVSLAGGAQNMAALPPVVVASTSLSTPARGVDPLGDVIQQKLNATQQKEAGAFTSASLDAKGILNDYSWVPPELRATGIDPNILQQAPTGNFAAKWAVTVGEDLRAYARDINTNSRLGMDAAGNWIYNRDPTVYVATPQGWAVFG